MVAELSSKANKFLIVGFLIEVAANALRVYYANDVTVGLVGMLADFVGIALFVYGCAVYSQAKGHSKWFGLLGLFSLLGLLGLVFLSDKNKIVKK